MYKGHRSSRLTVSFLYYGGPQRYFFTNDFPLETWRLFPCFFPPIQTNQAHPWDSVDLGNRAKSSTDEFCAQWPPATHTVGTNLFPSCHPLLCYESSQDTTAPVFSTDCVKDVGKLLSPTDCFIWLLLRVTRLHFIVCKSCSVQSVVHKLTCKMAKSPVKRFFILTS